MNDVYDILFHFADDAELKIKSLEENNIKLSVTLPSQGNVTWLIESHDLVHLDIAPFQILGHVDFGSLSLLPKTYLNTRNIDYGGKESDFRVLKTVDIDNKEGYLIIFGKETITTSNCS